MAEPESAITNAGEEISTPSAPDLRLSSETQFRVINQRLDTLAQKVDRIAAPPVFRLADVIQLGVIAAGIVIAVLTALGFSERLSDLIAHLSEAERRVTASQNAAELRLQAKLDKLSEQLITIGERTSRLEGARDAEKAAKPQP